MRVRLPSIALAVLAVMAAAGAASSGTAGWSAKVAPALLADAASGETEFFVELGTQADVSGAYKLRTKEAKGRFVYERLTATARATQAPLRARLTELGLPHRPYWIVNAIWVRGDLRAVAAMASRPDVMRVFANVGGRLVRPVRAASTGQDSARRRTRPDTLEPDLTLVRAHEVWAMGYKGQGAVVASADTGVRWDHDALKAKYRGWDGTTASHDYNWHDGIGSGNGACPVPAAAPCDDNNHGSHTTGTMVGSDAGDVNQIGMAPDAKWIACRNMDAGNGTPSTYLNCMQWLLAPTKIDGSNPDSTKAPDVVNNSWSCTAAEGCSVPQPTLRTTLANSRAAGIVYVVSAGNSGPNCGTVNNPLGIYKDAFSVGATDGSTNPDLAANFSSRGPAIDEALTNPKPDISAPGVGVRSSLRTTTSAYGSLSGTSMAAPHVAGLVALIISAKPALAGNVGAIEDIIEQSAVDRVPPVPLCGTDGATSVPNNTYGYGRIDAKAAVDLALATPTVAVVSSLVATRTRTAVVVRWRTASESRGLGFDVARSTTVKGRFTRLTASVISARGSAAGGAYRYVDRTARLRRSYVYRLEAVGLDGTRRVLGKVRVRAG